MADQLENPTSGQDRKERCLFRESNPADRSAVREILLEANLSFHGSDDIANDSLNESRGPASPLEGATFTWLCEIYGEIVAVLQWRHLGEEAEILEAARIDFLKRIEQLVRKSQPASSIPSGAAGRCRSRWSRRP